MIRVANHPAQSRDLPFAGSGNHRTRRRGRKPRPFKSKLAKCVEIVPPLRFGKGGWLKLNYCTVSVVDPVIPPELAPITVVPAAMQFAWPPTLGALAMVATVACDELQ
jgi:hypothetical protein